MAIYSGTTGSVSSNLYTFRRKFSLKDVVAELHPSETPFLTLLYKLGKETVKDVDVWYMEHRSMWLDDVLFYLDGTISGMSAASAGNTFAISIKKNSSGGGVTFLQGDEIIEVADAGNPGNTARFIVTGVPSSAVISVKLITNVPGWEAVSNDTALVVGIAKEEGFTATESFYDEIERRWASCQEFSETVNLTEIAAKLDLYGGNERMRQRKEKLAYLKMAVERALKFGERYSSVKGDPWAAPGSGTLLGSTYPKRTTLGIFTACEYASNVNANATTTFVKQASTYTFSDFMDDVDLIFEYGSSTKVCIGGGGFITKLNKVAASTNLFEITEPSKSEVGLNIQSLITPGAVIKLIRDPSLRKSPYKNMAVFIDMNNVKLMVFNDFELRADILGDNVHKIMDEVYFVGGLKVMMPETHASFKFY